MKVIPKMAGALILMVILVASASVVAADTADTKDSPSYQITVGDEDESGNVVDIDEKTDVPDYEVGDDGTTNIDTGDEELVYLHGTGTLFAMGNGRAILRGTGRVLIFAEEANVIVSSNAWVRALGDWNVECLGHGRVKYTGSGVLQIRGHRITADISGKDISLKASGRGSAVLKGDWNYWVIHRPRLWVTAQSSQYRSVSPCCTKIQPVSLSRTRCRISTLPTEYAPVV